MTISRFKCCKNVPRLRLSALCQDVKFYSWMLFFPPAGFSVPDNGELAVPGEHHHYNTGDHYLKPTERLLAEQKKRFGGGDNAWHAKELHCSPYLGVEELQ